MKFRFRGIEPKMMENAEHLERERLGFAPVLGKDAWYACLWYAIWRVVTVHFLTPAGVWVTVATVLAYRVTIKVIDADGTNVGVPWTVYGFGAHCILSWLWLCAREQAKAILAAVPDLIRAAAERVKGGKA